MLQNGGALYKASSPGSALRPVQCTVHHSGQPLIFQSSTPVVNSPTAQQVFRPISATPGNNPGSLKEGAAIIIDGQSFLVRGRLGAGSFGNVWESCSQNGLSIAIKEIVCGSEGELAEAESEVSHLRFIARNGTKHVPALVAAQRFRISASAWKILLAMIRIPGEELHKFSMNQSSVVPTHPLNVQACLLDACRFSGSMLRQMAQTFVDLSPAIIHRDAHLRNMLVADGNTLWPKFGLVDFGLAVDAPSWKQGRWKDHNVCGDCRYWPASVWYLFSHGTNGISEQPELCEEYKTRLDFHSIGLSGVQLFVNMMVPLFDSPAAEAPYARSVLSALQRLHRSLQTYWSDSSYYWSLVCDSFQGKQDINIVRDHCSNANVTNITIRNLKDLKESVRNLSDVCGIDALTNLSNTFQRLISIGDGASSMPTWQEIQTSLINPEEAWRPAPSTEARPGKISSVHGSPMLSATRVLETGCGIEWKKKYQQAASPIAGEPIASEPIASEPIANENMEVEHSGDHEPSMPSARILRTRSGSLLNNSNQHLSHPLTARGGSGALEKSDDDKYQMPTASRILETGCGIEWKKSMRSTPPSDANACEKMIMETSSDHGTSTSSATRILENGHGAENNTNKQQSSFSHGASGGCRFVQKSDDHGSSMPMATRILQNGCGIEWKKENKVILGKRGEDTEYDAHAALTALATRLLEGTPRERYLSGAKGAKNDVPPGEKCESGASTCDPSPLVANKSPTHHASIQFGQSVTSDSTGINETHDRNGGTADDVDLQALRSEIASLRATHMQEIEQLKQEHSQMIQRLKSAPLLGSTSQSTSLVTRVLNTGCGIEWRTHAPTNAVCASETHGLEKLEVHAISPPMSTRRL